MRRPTIGESRYPETNDFMVLLRDWRQDAIVRMLGFVWSGYDLLARKACATSKRPCITSSAFGWADPTKRERSTSSTADCPEGGTQMGAIAMCVTDQPCDRWPPGNASCAAAASTQWTALNSSRRATTRKGMASTSIPLGPKTGTSIGTSSVRMTIAGYAIYSRNVPGPVLSCATVTIR